MIFLICHSAQRHSFSMQWIAAFNLVHIYIYSMAIYWLKPFCVQRLKPLTWLEHWCCGGHNVCGNALWHAHFAHKRIQLNCISRSNCMYRLLQKLPKTYIHTHRHKHKHKHKHKAHTILRYLRDTVGFSVCNWHTRMFYPPSIFFERAPFC